MTFTKSGKKYLVDLAKSSSIQTLGKLINDGTITQIIRPRSKSPSQISPGDLFIFNYPYPTPETHIVLVVQNKRTSSGLFLSTQRNQLLSAFKLSSTSPEISAIILKNLYKNRAVSYDNVFRGLLRVLGKKNYRTYDIKYITSFNEIEYTDGRTTINS